MALCADYPSTGSGPAADYDGGLRRAGKASRRGAENAEKTCGLWDVFAQKVTKGTKVWESIGFGEEIQSLELGSYSELDCYS